MKIKLISDIHCEFHKDKGKRFANEFSVKDTDVLIIAGDLSTVDHLYTVLTTLCERVPHLVYVTGNHEYYNTSREVVNRSLQKITKKYKNFHWLNNSFTEINGQRFIGGTMWFPDSREAWVNEGRLTDFRVIKGFEKWVYKENRKTQNYLKENIQAGDVVVTHHLPSYYSIADQYEGSELNCYFVTRMDEVIKEKQPAAWMHGHTHESCNYTLGDTLVLCNPHGYKNTHDINKAFDKTLLVEV